MFVSFRKCFPPQKPDPISDRNCQNLYPFSDQNGSKTIPFGAAHTYIPYIGEYPPPPGKINYTFLKILTLPADNAVKTSHKKRLYSHSIFVLAFQPFQK